MRVPANTADRATLLWVAAAFTLVSIWVAVVVYLLAARTLMLEAASERLRLIAEQGQGEYRDLILKIEAWSAIIERRHAVLSLGADPALGPRLAGFLTDLVDQNPALDGVVITDQSGAILYSSSGPPGLYHEGFWLYGPGLEPEIVHALGHREVGFGIYTGRKFFQFWTLINVGVGAPLKVGFLVSEHQISHILAGAKLTEHITTAFISTSEFDHYSAVPDSGQVFLQEPLIPGVSGLNALRYELDAGKLLREEWNPEVSALGGLTSVAVLVGLGLLGATRWLARSREHTRHIAVRSREWLQALFAAASDAILIVDEDHVIVALNDAVEEVFGWKPDDIRGRELALLIPEESNAKHPNLVSSFFSKRENLSRMGDFRRVRAIRQNGQSFPVMISLGYAEVDGVGFAIAIARDMTSVEDANQQLVSLTTELSNQLDAAEAANHAKTQFLANVSHELRTPLNAIIGFSEVIHHDMLGKGASSEYSEYAGDILKAGLHLQDLIENVLDFARLDAGKHPINMDVYTVGEIWALPIENLAIVARNNGVSLLLDPVYSELKIETDLRAIRQCLFNIIGNAIKFSPYGGHVRCCAEVDGSNVVFMVSDEGPGIPEKAIPHLMRPFVQVGNPYHAETKGTGLGLAITKQLTELMGGRLLLESRDGAGTIIRIKLPQKISNNLNVI